MVCFLKPFLHFLQCCLQPFCWGRAPPLNKISNNWSNLHETHLEPKSQGAYWIDRIWFLLFIYFFFTEDQTQRRAKSRAEGRLTHPGLPCCLQMQDQSQMSSEHSLMHLHARKHTHTNRKRANELEARPGDYLTPISGLWAALKLIHLSELCSLTGLSRALYYTQTCPPGCTGHPKWAHKAAQCSKE